MGPNIAQVRFRLNGVGKLAKLRPIRIASPAALIHPVCMPSRIRPNFAGQVRAVDRVEQLLRQVTQAPDGAGIA